MVILVICSAGLDAQTYSILPMGNSITQGYGLNNGTPPISERISYRLQLLNDLVAAGYSIDYIGHMNTGYDLMTDADHCGVMGFRDQHVLRLLQDGYDDLNNDQVTPGSEPYLDIFTPDIILLHIGTNDIINGEGPDATTVSQVLDEIDSWESDNGAHITVFISRIINRYPNDATVTQFNDNVAAMVAGRADPSIILVDMESGAGIDYSTEMYSDGIHLLQSANDKMGQNWYTSVNAYLSAIPVPPSGLYLDGETTGSIDLHWSDNSDNETGFQIERSLTGLGGDFTLIQTTAAGVTAYTSGGLNDNTTYFYRVRAINATGPSLYSSVESTNTLLESPAAPSGLSVGSPTTSSLQLSWTDNSDNESEFRIERATAVGGPYSEIATPSANNTTYTNTGLEDATQYFYRVRAYNAAGFSTYSNIANNTTLLAPPAAPSGS